MLKLKVKTFDHGDAGVVPQGVDVQEQIMVAPSPEDKMAVNGVELTALSTLFGFASTGIDAVNFRWTSSMLQQVDQSPEEDVTGSSALCSQTCRGYDAT